MIKLPPELEGEYTIRVVDMPECSTGFVLYDDDDHANIFLNARYTRESNLDTADHELTHILNDDFHNDDDIRTVEARANAKCSGEPCSPHALSSIPNLMKASDLLPRQTLPDRNDEIPAKPGIGVRRSPAILSPHQAAVLIRALSDLDAWLFREQYDY